MSGTGEHDETAKKKTDCGAADSRILRAGVSGDPDGICDKFHQYRLKQFLLPIVYHLTLLSYIPLFVVLF